MGSALLLTAAVGGVGRIAPRQPSTLAIRGAESDSLFPKAWALWQTVQPETTFVEIPDAGHMVTMERPRQVADVVLEFLHQ